MSRPTSRAASVRVRLGIALAALLLAPVPGFAQQDTDQGTDQDTEQDTEQGADQNMDQGVAQGADGSAGQDAGTADPAGGATADAAAAPPVDPSSGGVRRVPEGVAEAASGSGSDYPTVARADYVLGCMAANGNDWEALQQCSCSIDYIRERMDWETYERANTVMQVQLDRGQRGIFYRDSNWAKSRVDRLQALQAESSLRCF